MAPSRRHAKDLATGTLQLLAFGTLAIAAAAVLLACLVRELAPAARRRWLLGVALGTGVIAFTLKIALIVVFSTLADPVLALLPERPRHAAVGSGPAASTAYPATPTVQRIWRTLPTAAPYPSDNPPSPEKIALGRRLFFDPRLSADDTLACASCHRLSETHGGGDARARAQGIGGQQGARNAPTVFNAAFQRVLFWDGRATSLEEQAKGPLTNPLEMGMPSLRAVEAKVRAMPDYPAAFARVFATQPPVTIDNIAKALAAYERTLITPDSPYDRFVAGDAEALSALQIRGMALFEAVGCIQCHSGPNFSGASLLDDNAALRLFPAVRGTDFEYRYRLADDTGAAGGGRAGVWRIPSLRNVARTAPYFHNGSVDSLREAVRIMARVQLDKTLSGRTIDDRVFRWSVSRRRFSDSAGNAVSDADVDAIVAFLEALNGPLPGDL